MTGAAIKANATATPVSLVSAIAYEPFGPLSSISYGNGMTLAQNWGTDRRLYAKDLKTAAGVSLWSKTYTYDGDDNMLTIGDPLVAANAATLTYDAKSRLTRAVGNYGTTKREDYGYDANDNRLTLEQRNSSTAPTPTTTLTSTITAGTNRLASVTGGTTTRQLSYDGRGNIGGDVRGTVTNTALYDAYGRLNSYAKTGANTWTMKYNGDDERVEVRIGTGTPRRFVYDEDGRLIGEYGNTVATINAEHVWLMPAANEGGYEPLALVGPTTTSWVHGDHLGTPVKITSSAGVEVNEMQAAPFGARFRTATSSPKTALALPGQIIDIADRHYNMHRDYDPTLGRYLQADPIGLDGGDNLYGYVGGNPVTGMDPSGLICTYVQGTGAMTCLDASRKGYYKSEGYAGTGKGRNNPDAQGQASVGPLPRGDWKVVGDWYNSPNTGRNTIKLSPMPGNECPETKRDCSSFRIHGNNRRNDASHGCIVLPRNRTTIPPGEVIRVVK